MVCVFITFCFMIPLVANVLLSLITTILGEQALAKFKGAESGCLYPNESDGGAALFDGPTSHHEDHHPNYVRIWLVLLVLLVISVLGPTLEIKVITLITAFGVALIKAYLVVAYFMHLKFEKKIAHYILIACLGLMAVFVAGTAPDVHKHEGTNWDNVSAKAEVRRGLRAMLTPGHDAAAEGAHDAPEATPAEPAGPRSGADVYSTYCLACHGADGAGNGGMAANFITDPTRLAQPRETVIAAIKDGRTGDIGVMPPWAGTLSDEEIANVYDHLMKSWGKAGG